MAEKYVNVNPKSQGGGADPNRKEFAALVRVKSSRYVERTYQDPALKSKVAIKWEMGTTKGNTFDRMWTTGILWDGGKNVSADGKKLKVQISKNSDANYLLKKIIAAEFPSDRITDDISVFEGETFFMAEDTNPNSKGSYVGLYPKRYHAEGWDAALSEALSRRAAREAQQNAPAYTANTETTLQSGYTPPAVIQSDVLQTAAEALVAIVKTNGSTVNRIQIPAKLSGYVEQDQKSTGKIWDKTFRENVTAALWNMESLKSIVGNNPALKIEDETISFK